MWARWIELGLGIWLLLCPWILPSHAGGERFAILGLLTIVASIASVFRPGGWIHWIVPAAGVALITISVLTAPHPLPPLLQNNVIVGLTLLMLGVVPDRAFEPPRRWRELEARIRSREGAPLPRVSNTLESPDFSRKTTPGGIAPYRELPPDLDGWPQRFDRRKRRRSAGGSLTGFAREVRGRRMRTRIRPRDFCVLLQRCPRTRPRETMRPRRDMEPEREPGRGHLR